jgi:hypothetical protein
MLSEKYSDQICKRATFRRRSVLFEDIAGTQPYDTTGHTIEGFVAREFNSVSPIALTVVFDSDRTTGQFYFSLTSLQIAALEIYPTYRLWIILIYPSGDREVVLESDDVAVIP